MKIVHWKDNEIEVTLDPSADGNVIHIIRHDGKRLAKLNIFQFPLSGGDIDVIAPPGHTPTALAWSLGDPILRFNDPGIQTIAIDIKEVPNGPTQS